MAFIVMSWYSALNISYKFKNVRNFISWKNFQLYLEILWIILSTSLIMQVKVIVLLEQNTTQDTLAINYIATDEICVYSQLCSYQPCKMALAMLKWLTSWNWGHRAEELACPLLHCNIADLTMWQYLASIISTQLTILIFNNIICCTDIVFKKLYLNDCISYNDHAAIELHH